MSRAEPTVDQLIPVAIRDDAFEYGMTPCIPLILPPAATPLDGK
jgi:hypothetical protein